MNFHCNSVIVIIAFLSHHSSSLPISPSNRYHLDQICVPNARFQTLKPEISRPIKLLLTPTQPIRWQKNYCIFKVTVGQNQSISVEGLLGALRLVQSKSDATRLHFELNQNITDNQVIDEKFFSEKVTIIVDNKENVTNDELLETELDIKAFVKEEEDCEESNKEELDLDEFSGQSPICPDNNCGIETQEECADDNESKCKGKVTQEVEVISDDNPQDVPVIELVRTSGSDVLAVDLLVGLSLQLLLIWHRY